MPRRVPLVFLVALSLLLAVPLLAQTVTGTLSGTVNDSTKSPLPGVTVTIRNVDTALERILVTNQNGFYNAPFLPVGRYNVQAELSGFGVVKRNNVRVELNTNTVQNFVLDPAMVTETVVVVADAPRINVSDGEIKQNMRAEEIMQIPQGSQTSFLGLASTFSGYMDNPTATSADNPTLSVGSSANFNGAGTRGTTFQINGVNNDDSSENQHRQGVALATIKSFQILTNSYSAEFGRGYGAVVLVQTKSGTNEFDGEAYGYMQDGEWNDKRALEEAAPKPDNYRRQYGGVLGGPIVSDRLFAFANYDMVVNKGQLIATKPVILPSDLALPRLTLGNDTAANRAWQDSILSRWPSGLTPNNPAVSNRAYSYPQFRDYPDEDYSLRLDWNANLSHNVNARYQHSAQKRENTEIIVGEQTMQDNEQWNLGVTWTGVLSANTVMEARYGLGDRSTNVNILAGNDTPIVRWSAITPGHIIGNAGVYPINRDQTDQQFVLNVSSARFATHTLKAGTDIRLSSLDDRAQNFNRGFWSFSASCGGVNYGTGLAAFMAGCVSSFQRSYGPDYLENDLGEINLYAQDDWRPFDNLTLNLGVRYEQVKAPEEGADRVDYMFNTTDYVDPRLGFAYTPNWEGSRFLRALTGGEGKFSIRGGYGIYHGRVFQSVFSQSGANVRYNPPNAVMLSIANSTNIADPTNGFVFVPGQPLTQRVSLTLVDPELQMPETRQWNLSFERQVFSASRVRVSYVGTLGKNLLQYGFDNLPEKPGPDSQWKIAQDVRCAGTGLAGAPKNATCPNDVPLGQYEVSLRFPKTNERRPDARYTTNLIVQNLAESSYHAGQIEFESGLTHGFQGRVTYTFSKAMDTGSEATSSGTGDINMFPPEAEKYKRGLSRFDTRHRLTGTGSYQIPGFNGDNGWKNFLLGGWTVAGVVRVASGTPFTIIDSGASDIDFDGVANQRPVPVNSACAGGWTINYPGNSQQQLNTACFRRLAPGDSIDDTVGRNTYFTDGLESVDMGLYKSFRAPMNSSVVFRLDVFNVFNHVTWGFPTNDFANANFGRITGTNPGYNPRTYQLGLRYIF